MTEETRTLIAPMLEERKAAREAFEKHSKPGPDFNFELASLYGQKVLQIGIDIICIAEAECD